jgi:hypothetical protein
VAGCCEHGDEPSGFIKDGGFNKLSVLLASQGLCSMEIVLPQLNSRPNK